MILYYIDTLGVVGETYKNFDERNKWLVEKVHTGTHVILFQKRELGERITNDDFLKVQVVNLSITKYFEGLD